MNLIVAALVGLALVLGTEATFGGGKFLSFDDHEKSAKTANLLTEDRFKKNQEAESSDKESDKFGLRKGDGEQHSIKESSNHESLFEFEDFEDKAGKNDLSKSNNFGVKLQDVSHEDSSNEFKSSRGSDLKSKESSSFDKDADSKIFHNDKLDASSDSESHNRFAKEFGTENLFGDRTESLLDSGLELEFGIGNGLHGGLSNGLRGGLSNGLHRGLSTGHSGHRVNKIGVNNHHIGANSNIGVGEDIGIINGIDTDIGHTGVVLNGAGINNKVGHKNDVLNGVGHGDDGILSSVGVGGSDIIDEAIGGKVTPEVSHKIGSRVPNIQLRGRLSDVLSMTRRIGRL